MRSKIKYAAAVFLLCAIATCALVNFVQSVSGSGSTTAITSPSITIGSGHLVIVVFFLTGNGSNSAVISSVTDTIGNTYTLAVAHAFNASLFGGTEHWMFYKENATGGTGTISTSWTNTVGASSMFVAEYSGAVTSGALDQASTKSTTGTPQSSTAVTTTVANEIITSSFVTSATGCLTPAGFTSRSGFLDMNVNATGTYTVTSTGCTSSPYTNVTATFKAASVGGAGQVGGFLVGP
jgi:hypothetical protein